MKAMKSQAAHACERGHSATKGWKAISKKKKHFFCLNMKTGNSREEKGDGEPERWKPVNKVRRGETTRNAALTTTTNVVVIIYRS